MKRRSFLQFLGLAAAAPLAITKAIEDVKPSPAKPPTATPYLRQPDYSMVGTCAIVVRDWPQEPRFNVGDIVQIDQEFVTITEVKQS